MSFRLAAVISHPTQHYSPVFRELAKVPGLRVRAFYACDHAVRESYDPGFDTRFAWDVPLLDGYDSEILRPGYSPSGFGFWQVDCAFLPRRLELFRPHVMWVHGYGQRLCWRAVNWAKKRCAIVFFGDSELLHRRSVTSRALKRVALTRFFRHCHAFITIGDNNEAYYRHYGVPKEKLFRGACPVDVARFEEIMRESSDARRKVRERYGISSEDFVVLALGKLERRKRPQDLIGALSILRPRKEIKALFVGDGLLRQELLTIAKRRGVEDRLRITGFVNQNQIPAVLQAGDLLAMMSEFDPHPLAVSEVLIGGYPIVISDRVGCVGFTDTARPGSNAIVYPCGDVFQLAQAVVCLADDEPLRSRMAAISRALAWSQDVSVTVKTVLDIIMTLRPQFGHQWRDVSEDAFHRIADYRQGLEMGSGGTRGVAHG